MKCHKCGTCERLLPGFISRYNGLLPISENSYKTEEVFESIRSIKDACPEGAIDINLIQ